MMLSTLVTELTVALIVVAVAVGVLLRRGQVGSGSIARVLIATLILMLVITAMVSFARLQLNFGGLPSAPAPPPSFSTPDGGNSIVAP